MNDNDIKGFLAQRASEPIDVADSRWADVHQAAVINSMIQLNQRLKGARIVNVGEVMNTIEIWAFDKPSVNMGEQHVETSILSLAPNEPVQSFLEIRQMLEDGR